MAIRVRRLNGGKCGVNTDAHSSSLLINYDMVVAKTDKLPKNQIRAVLMGFFAEVGGVMASSKKLIREGDAYIGHKNLALEEFGDALWYLTALSHRRNSNIAQLYVDACDNLIKLTDIDTALFKLGHKIGEVLESSLNHEVSQSDMTCLLSLLLDAIVLSGLDLEEVLQVNEKKVYGAFLEPNISSLPTFDSEFAEDERLPERFTIHIVCRSSGKTQLQWNGVFIGDSLSDNAADADFYRYHDIFHLAHAAILNWSPVFRSLIKQKRKSNGYFDESQDGGRAIVVEEGLTAWIFARAKQLNYFHGHEKVSLDILKTVSEFTSDFEVSKCPSKLWERAILQGYEVFRQVKDHKTGLIVGDRVNRTIRFESI